MKSESTFRNTLSGYWRNRESGVSGVSGVGGVGWGTSCGLLVQESE